MTPQDLANIKERYNKIAGYRAPVQDSERTTYVQMLHEDLGNALQYIAELELLGPRAA